MQQVPNFFVEDKFRRQKKWMRKNKFGELSAKRYKKLPTMPSQQQRKGHQVN